MLSVKSDVDGDVKSYRIRRSDYGGFYISSKEIFDNMLDLVANYRRKIPYTYLILYNVYEWSVFVFQFNSFLFYVKDILIVYAL